MQNGIEKYGSAFFLREIFCFATKILTDYLTYYI